MKNKLFCWGNIMKQNKSCESCGESLNDVFSLLTARDYMWCETNLSLSLRLE